MKRIFLFVMTNIAVLAVISVVLFALNAFFGVNTSGYNQAGQIDYVSTLLISAVVGFSGAFISLAMSKWMAKRSMGVVLIDQPTNSREMWLKQVVERQSRQAGIKTPEFGIFPSEAPNAFATGARKNAALVAVSQGLLNNMTQDEVEAVIGHEISHVANGDMVTLTLIQGVVNTFVFFFARIAATIIDRAIFKTERGRGPGYFIANIVLQILFGILASAIVAWFSRYREYKADAGGARLAGRAKMIAALERLKGAQPAPMPAQMEAMGINKSAVKKMFSTHPPLEDRIAALRNNPL